MNYCASCRLADDHGILGTVTTCTRDGQVRTMGDTCDAHVPDERSFAERYPEYVDAPAARERAA